MLSERADWVHLRRHSRTPPARLRISVLGESHSGVEHSIVGRQVRLEQVRPPSPKGADLCTLVELITDCMGQRTIDTSKPFGPWARRLLLAVSASTLVATASSCAAMGEFFASLDTPPTADTLRVLAYNIHHGEGMDSVIDLQRIADLILEVDPDIVTLQEVDSMVTRTGRINQAAVLGRLTGMTPIFGRFMPYQGGAYGMAVLSRWRMRDVDNYRLPDGAEPRTALTVVITSPTTGQPVRVSGIHFYRTEFERAAQADALMGYLAAAVDPDMPTILAGDFNSEPYTRVINDLRRGWTIVDKGDDNLTFSSFDPVREIDFMMYRPDDRFEVLGQWVLDEPVISDHRPVVTDFVIRRQVP